MQFPYTVRIISDILESNGSSSMASSCGGCLALMDAGVPITKPVAGISVGLVQEGDKYELLTDIIGEEDHFGDMDFKVCGTRDGITAIQLDIKTEGIDHKIIRDTLHRAKEARLIILEKMAETLARAAHGNQQVRPAPADDQDRPGKDRQAHRPRRQEHQGPPGRHRRQHRHRRRRHGLHLAPSTARPPRSAATSSKR